MYCFKTKERNTSGSREWEVFFEKLNMKTKNTIILLL